MNGKSLMAHRSVFKVKLKAQIMPPQASSLIPEARLWWMMVAQGVGGSFQFGHPKLDPSFGAEAGCSPTGAPGEQVGHQKNVLSRHPSHLTGMA
jgi:hypothetical protein